MVPLDGPMSGSYNHVTVVLSALIALLASYTALDLAERVTAARGTVRLAWLMSGSVAMGIGIWSMHYTAMLAFHLPVPVWYHWPTVLLSLLLGIAASAAALFVVSRKTLGWPGGSGWRDFPGRGHCGTALHRHGGDAAVRHVSLLSPNRRPFGSYSRLRALCCRYG